MNHENAESVVACKNEDERLLDFLVISALQASSCWLSTYINNHPIVSDDARGRLAMARLQWTIEKGRESLSGQLTGEEFAVVCSAFYLEITAPYDMERIEQAVADEYRIDINNYKSNPSAARLIDKLKILNPSARVALLDLVEMFWHGPRDKDRSIDDFMLSCEVRPAKN